MVVHAGALDTPQVGKEHAGKVGVILLQHSRHLPIEIQSFQPPEEKHQEPAGHDLQDIHGTVGTAALLRSGPVDLPHHLTGHSGQGPVLRSCGHHQFFLTVVLKPLFRHKAKGDLVALVIPPSGDVAVQIRPQVYGFGNGHEDTVEQGGLVFVLSPVLFLDIAQGLRHVKFHIDVDLGVGALIHQMGHDGVKPVQIPDPVCIRPVTPSFRSFFHNSLPFCHAKA